VFGPALIALAFLGLWQGSLRQRDHASAELRVARAEVKQRDAVIATDRTSYRAAAVIAERQTAERIVAIEARHFASKKEADRAYATDLARAQRLAADYIATHRMQPNAAAATADGRAGAAAVAAAQDQPDFAGKPKRAGPAPIMVAISADDIDVCTVNTTRLVNAKAWAEGLTK